MYRSTLTDPAGAELPDISHNGATPIGEMDFESIHRGRDARW